MRWYFRTQCGTEPTIGWSQYDFKSVREDPIRKHPLWGNLVGHHVTPWTVFAFPAPSKNLKLHEDEKEGIYEGVNKNKEWP